MILGENNEKMSKSKGNVVNPDDVVESHGADTLRLYEMFMGPLDGSIAWSTNGLDGARRFLERIWRLYVNEETGKLNEKIQATKGDESFLRAYHQTVKKVTEDMSEMRFNVAISQMMVFINEGYKQDVLPRDLMEGFVKMLSPITPHLAEELWNKLGYEETISYEQWPTYEEAYLVENEIEVVAQINGKVRAKLIIPADASREQMQELALADDKIKAAINDKTVRKVIAVPGKLVNIVVG